MLRPRDTATRECRSLDGLWQFALDADGVGRDQGWWNGPLAGARDVPVPVSYNDLFADARVRNHVGDVWYQTLVRVPARWAGERIVLHFDAATHGAVAWVDGTQVAEHQGGFIAVAGGVGSGSVPAAGIACYGVLYFGMGLINTLIFAIQPDTVDYGERKTGVRGEGSAYSVLSFTRKVGQGVGRAAASFTIGLGLRLRRGRPDRRGGHLDQGGRRPRPRRGRPDRRLIMVAYPLTEDVVRRIVGETASRQAARRAGAAAGTSARPAAG